MYSIDYAAMSILGCVRNNHEDNVYIDSFLLPMNNSGLQNIMTGTLSSDDIPLLGVFDGMGGESCGEAAAFVAGDTMRRLDAHRRQTKIAETDIPSFMNDLCSAMNTQVCNYAKEKKISTMGSTCVFMMISDESVCFANIGDSRIYHVHNGNLVQLSEDQVLESCFYAKPPLVQYLGLKEEEMALLPQIEKILPEEGDSFLLCSDGVSDMIPEDRLLEIMQADCSARECMELLEKEILVNGARDNATAILSRLHASH